MRVLLLWLLCLCVVLPRGHAFSGTVNLTEQLYVPAGSFVGEPGVDLILNSANATGPVLSLVIPPTVSTACPMLDDREASGVFFNLTRNDGLSGALGLTVNALFRQNTPTTYRRAFRDLYVCVDGVWQRSAEVNCTAPFAATTVGNASIFLQTTLCHNTPFAVLQLDASKCDSDFLRHCNECIEGYYGCGCDIPSNNLYTGRDMTRMLAWFIALTFAAAATIVAFDAFVAVAEEVAVALGGVELQHGKRRVVAERGLEKDAGVADGGGGERRRAVDLGTALPHAIHTHIEIAEGAAVGGGCVLAEQGIDREAQCAAEAVVAREVEEHPTGLAVVQHGARGADGGRNHQREDRTRGVGAVENEVDAWLADKTARGNIELFGKIDCAAEGVAAGEHHTQTQKPQQQHAHDGRTRSSKL
jgi:hypothetical protein